MPLAFNLSSYVYAYMLPEQIIRGCLSPPDTEHKRTTETYISEAEAATEKLWGPQVGWTSMFPNLL